MYYSVISWGSLLVRRQFLFPFPPRNPTRHNASRKCKTHAWGASDPSILPTKALALACFIGHVQAVFVVLLLLVVLLLILLLSVLLLSVLLLSILTLLFASSFLALAATAFLFAGQGLLPKHIEDLSGLLVEVHMVVGLIDVQTWVHFLLLSVDGLAEQPSAELVILIIRGGQRIALLAGIGLILFI